MASSSDVLLVGGLVTAAVTGTLWRAWAIPAEQACYLDVDVLESVRCAPAAVTTSALKWATVAVGALTGAALIASMVGDHR